MDVDEIDEDDNNVAGLGDLPLKNYFEDGHVLNIAIPDHLNSGSDFVTTIKSETIRIQDDLEKDLEYLREVLKRYPSEGNYQLLRKCIYQFMEKLEEYRKETEQHFKKYREKFDNDDQNIQEKEEMDYALNVTQGRYKALDAMIKEQEENLDFIYKELHQPGGEMNSHLVTRKVKRQ